MTTPLMAWATTPIEGWGKQVDSWQPWEPWIVEGAKLGYVKTGDCPRCLHPIAIYQHFYRGITEDVGYVVAQCNCQSPHTGRPADILQGCGQSAQIDPNK